MQWLMEKQGRIHSNLIGVRMCGAVGSILGRGIDVGDRSQNALNQDTLPTDRSKSECDKLIYGAPVESARLCDENFQCLDKIVLNPAIGKLSPAAMQTSKAGTLPSAIVRNFFPASCFFSALAFMG